MASTRFAAIFASIPGFWLGPPGLSSLHSGKLQIQVWNMEQMEQDTWPEHPGGTGSVSGLKC